MKQTVTSAVLVTLLGAFDVSSHAQPAKTAEQSGTSGGREVQITVADAVKSALEHNPDARQLKLEVAIADAEIDRQRGEFQPVVTTTAAHREQGGYTTSVFAGTTSPTVTTRTTFLESIMRGRTMFGGVYTATISSQRVGGFSLGSTLLPIYQTTASARYQQSLLRGAGRAVNRSAIDRAELAEEAARVDYENQRLALALEVVASYWSLVVRREQVAIRLASLSESQDLRELVQRRIRAGQSAKSDALQADATVGEREQLLRQARLAVIDAERALLAVTFLNRSGTFRWQDVLVPADKPRDIPTSIDFDAELAAALKERPEVQRIEKALALARLDHRIATDNTRVRLDVYGEAGVLGLAGTPVAGAMIPELVIGGFGTSTGNLVTGRAPFFEVGVQLEIPIGNAARASAARQAELRVEKVLAEDVRTLISLDMRAAMQALEVAVARLQGARTVASVAAQNVEAQRKRYESGAATIFDTLRVQDELARAQAEIALAAAEQEVALARFVAARGTLLKQYGIAPAK